TSAPPTGTGSAGSPRPSIAPGSRCRPSPAERRCGRGCSPTGVFSTSCSSSTPRWRRWPSPPPPSPEPGRSSILRRQMLGDKLIEALTFDDVLLVPAASSVLPAEVDVSTRLTTGIDLRIPLLSSAMDTVTESATAIRMAREGGIGIVHKNLTIEQQAREITRVKKAQ